MRHMFLIVLYSPLMQPIQRALWTLDPAEWAADKKQTVGKRKILIRLLTHVNKRIHVKFSSSTKEVVVYYVLHWCCGFTDWLENMAVFKLTVCFWSLRAPAGSAAISSAAVPPWAFLRRWENSLRELPKRLWFPTVLRLCSFAAWTINVPFLQLRLLEMTSFYCFLNIPYNQLFPS